MQQSREKFSGRPGVHEPTPRELEWRDTMRRYRESGVTVVAFCKRERFALSLFYYWKREIARRDLGLPKASSNGKPRASRESRRFVRASRRKPASRRCALLAHPRGRSLGTARRSHCVRSACAFARVASRSPGTGPPLRPGAPPPGRT
jgi:hypothetical protein